MNTTQITSDDARGVAARHLIALYDERVRLSAAFAAEEHPTGAGARAVLDKGAELDAACEAFRRRFYPRRAVVCVGLWQVMVRSATGRRTDTVLDLFDEYHAKATA